MYQNFFLFNDFQNLGIFFIANYIEYKLKLLPRSTFHNKLAVLPASGHQAIRYMEPWRVFAMWVHGSFLHVDPILSTSGMQQGGYFSPMISSEGSWPMSGARKVRAFNSSPQGQNGRHFTDHIFKWIFVNEKLCISIWIWLKFVSDGQTYMKSALVQVTVWSGTDNTPLFEWMLTQFTNVYMRHWWEMS